jgi:hypothetical protein
MLKTGLICNYFRTALDCGLFSRKHKGSLTKQLGRTGTFKPGPLPESGFRSGASPALADLGRPGLVLDKVWPRR